MRKEKPKKDRILDIALKEFGEKGFPAASTNEIAAKAGVSKGLIFYRFGSKSGLYTAVVRRCVEDLQKSLTALPSSSDAGFWEAVTRLAQGRTIFFSSHSLHLNILDEAFSRPPKELSSELAEFTELAEAAYQLAPLREKFQIVALKDESLRERAFELILMTLSHLQNKYARRGTGDSAVYGSFAELFTEVRAYIELIINGVGA